MQGNLPVRFLGEGVVVIPLSYPVNRSEFYPSSFLTGIISALIHAGQRIIFYARVQTAVWFVRAV